MKKIVFALSIAFLALLVESCIIPSFYSLYHEKDLVHPESVMGEWITSTSLWTITDDYDDSYILNYKECEDPIRFPENYSACTMAEFRMHFINLDGVIYANFLPIDYTNTENSLLLAHIRAYNTFAKIEFDTVDELNIYFIDYEWMEEQLENKPSSLAHLKVGNELLLTAKTDELQAFIRTHQDDESMFTIPIRLDRKQSFDLYPNH
ncbi:hypothetical protein N8482_02995 [Chitinophagales bacterium]|nr:hypothetical protein [Chitinophagales bacterium]